MSKSLGLCFFCSEPVPRSRQWATVKASGEIKGLYCSKGCAVEDAFGPDFRDVEFRKITYEEARAWLAQPAKAEK